MSIESTYFKAKKDKLLEDIDNLINEIKIIREDKESSQKLKYYLNNLSFSEAKLKKELSGFINIAASKSIKLYNINIVNVIRSLYEDIAGMAKSREIQVVDFFAEKKDIIVNADIQYLGKALFDIFIKALESIQKKSVFTFITELRDNNIEIGLSGKGTSLQLNINDAESIIEYHNGRVEIRTGDEDQVNIMEELTEHGG